MPYTIIFLYLYACIFDVECKMYCTVRKSFQWQPLLSTLFFLFSPIWSKNVIYDSYNKWQQVKPSSRLGDLSPRHDLSNLYTKSLKLRQPCLVYHFEPILTAVCLDSVYLVVWPIVMILSYRTINYYNRTNHRSWRSPSHTIMVGWTYTCLWNKWSCCSLRCKYPILATCL